MQSPPPLVDVPETFRLVTPAGMEQVRGVQVGKPPLLLVQFIVGAAHRVALPVVTVRVLTSLKEGPFGMGSEQ